MSRTGFERRAEFARDLVERVITRGIVRKGRDAHHFDEHPSDRDIIKEFIANSLALSITVIRVPAAVSQSPRQTTPAEVQLLEDLVEVAIDEHVARGGRMTTAFVVRKATCDANGDARPCVFPAGGTPSRWNPKPRSGVDSRDSVCAVSLKSTAVMSRRSDSAARNLTRARAEARRRARRRDPCFNQPERNAVAKGIASPFPPGRARDRGRRVDALRPPVAQNAAADGRLVRPDHARLHQPRGPDGRRAHHPAPRPLPHRPPPPSVVSASRASSRRRRGRERRSRRRRRARRPPSATASCTSFWSDASRTPTPGRRSRGSV